MNKPRKPRTKYETIHRVRWAAGDADLPTQELAKLQVFRLMAAGVAAEVVSFRRPKL